mmetsp:Transcript_1513/g.3478  ORF Transcript_1513/g.3478 Transcript_1513/m.3478 type:complete len:149 (+) Transcript_1513:238-684(+)
MLRGCWNPRWFSPGFRHVRACFVSTGARMPNAQRRVCCIVGTEHCMPEKGVESAAYQAGSHRGDRARGWNRGSASCSRPFPRSPRRFSWPVSTKNNKQRLFGEEDRLLQSGERNQELEFVFELMNGRVMSNQLDSLCGDVRNRADDGR